MDLTKTPSVLTNKTLLILLAVFGLFLRLWHINFGLPHSWYADEPEIGEPAIMYTYEIKSIIRNNDLYRLVPQSYVYGTFPIYFYTLAAMFFSKALGILGISFSKMDLYIFMRVINALVSLALVPTFYLLVKSLKLSKSVPLTIFGIFLMAFNWKLIVHAHYLNHDIVITLLITLANLFFYKYLVRRHALGVKDGDTLYTALFAIFFGLAISTKITSLLTLPLYLLVFAINRDFKGIFGSVLLIAGVFIVTNPFSWLFPQEFIGRVLEMRTKEAGMVFDSVDYSPFKYVHALSWMLTLPVLLMSVFGIILFLINFRAEQTNRINQDVENLHTKQFIILMILQVIFYLVFFSLQSRRVDRWMLPVLPNLMIFSLVGLDYLLKRMDLSKQKVILMATLGVTIVYYLYFPTVLLFQFQRHTPKSAAYIWAKENLPPNSTKFGITEEGLDPMNKLPNATIWQLNVYESEGAQFVYPPDPMLYDYIIISSRPISWIKNPKVVKKYPLYVKMWNEFDHNVNDPKLFKPIKRFILTRPNLIPLSDVIIYRRRLDI